jgi:hypothetical protein
VIVTSDGTEAPQLIQEDVLLAAAVDVPPGHVVTRGVWAFTVLLALVGGAAVLLAVGLVMVVGVLHADDPGLDQAVSRFTSAARALPGVRSVDAKPGLGDLGTTPKDVYGDVHLDGACTLTSLAATTRRLRAIVTRERTFLLHPTVWCHSRGLTVSPVAAITEQRLAVVGRLAEDRSLGAAALIVTQRGDDPSPDLDNSFAQLDLFVRPRSSGEAARDWLERVRSALPDVTVRATTGRPGDYLDVLALQDDQWTVVVQAQDQHSVAVLRTAIRMERSPSVLGAYVDGPGRQVAVIASTWDVLQDLRGSLPTPGSDEQPIHLTVTIAHERSH